MSPYQSKPFGLFASAVPAQSSPVLNGRTWILASRCFVMDGREQSYHTSIVDACFIVQSQRANSASPYECQDGTLLSADSQPLTVNEIVAGSSRVVDTQISYYIIANSMKGTSTLKAVLDRCGRTSEPKQKFRATFATSICEEGQSDDGSQGPSTPEILHVPHSEVLDDCIEILNETHMVSGETTPFPTWKPRGVQALAAHLLSKDMSFGQTWLAQSCPILVYPCRRIHGGQVFSSPHTHIFYLILGCRTKRIPDCPFELSTNYNGKGLAFV